MNKVRLVELLVHFEKSLEISGFTEVKANFKGFF